MNRTIILADQQDIIKAGILYLLGALKGSFILKEADSKKELLKLLSDNPQAMVILDFTGLDFIGHEDLSVISYRFREVHWVLFSDELSTDFIKYFVGNFTSFSIVFKDSRKEEITTAFNLALKNERYICSRAGIQLVSKQKAIENQDRLLTTSEKEILRLMAMGKTTKEIASERFSSIHTITTHRKNIFRKLEVNSVHEATRYALRAGIVDSAEYYI